MKNEKYTFGDLRAILQDEFDIYMGVVGKKPDKPPRSREKARLELCDIIASLVDQFGGKIYIKMDLSDKEEI